MRTNAARLTGALCAVAVTAALAGCAGDTTRDTFIHSHSLEGMQASVWVDPDGCKHWIIDDGAEGYMSPVLNLDGTPDCV